jgi:hypothetical protein
VVVFLQRLDLRRVVVLASVPVRFGGAVGDERGT